MKQELKNTIGIVLFSIMAAVAIELISTIL